MKAHKQEYEHYGVPEAVAKAYLAYVRDHIRLVREAGERLGVPEEQLALHDQSKFSQEEFVGYSLHFMGGGSPDLFAEAWLHHLRSFGGKPTNFSRWIDSRKAYWLWTF